MKFFGLILLAASTVHAGLEVSCLGKRYMPERDPVVIRQNRSDSSGDTSVRNEWPLRWKEQGYFQRNRDLGQAFIAEKEFTLAAIVLRTGNGTAAFLPGAAGAPVFVQFFEVMGTPVIDDNGTPPGAKATHGFSANHRCDDFIRGVTYRSLRVVHGGLMPNLAAAGDGRLTYMKWTLTGDDALRCEAGKRYAFMVGISEPGAKRAFTLANHNAAASPAAPSLTDAHDVYPGGWGLRREGNGKLPPTMIPGEARDELQKEALFPEGDARFALSPTTDGYPDVDTYRDLEFYLIAR